MTVWNNVFIVFVPSVVVGLLFWLVMWLILRQDRVERKAYKEALEAADKEEARKDRTN